MCKTQYAKIQRLLQNELTGNKWHERTVDFSLFGDVYLYFIISLQKILCGCSLVKDWVEKWKCTTEQTQQYFSRSNFDAPRLSRKTRNHQAWPEYFRWEVKRRSCSFAQLKSLHIDVNMTRKVPVICFRSDQFNYIERKQDFINFDLTYLDSFDTIHPPWWKNSLIQTAKCRTIDAKSDDDDETIAPRKASHFFSSAAKNRKC